MSNSTPAVNRKPAGNRESIREAGPSTAAEVAAAKGRSQQAWYESKGVQWFAGLIALVGIVVFLAVLFRKDPGDLAKIITAVAGLAGALGLGAAAASVAKSKGKQEGQQQGISAVAEQVTPVLKKVLDVIEPSAGSAPGSAVRYEGQTFTTESGAPLTSDAAGEVHGALRFLGAEN